MKDRTIDAGAERRTFPMAIAVEFSATPHSKDDLFDGAAHGADLCARAIVVPYRNVKIA